jgi:hypothetical protein
MADPKLGEREAAAELLAQAGCTAVVRPEGVHARMAQRLSGIAVIWRNWATGAPVKRSLISYDNGTHKESLI